MTRAFFQAGKIVRTSRKYAHGSTPCIAQLAINDTAVAFAAAPQSPSRQDGHGKEPRLERNPDALATLTALRLVQRTTHGRADNPGQRLIVLQRLLARHPDDVDLLAEVGLTEVALGREGAALMT